MLSNDVLLLKWELHLAIMAMSTLEKELHWERSNWADQEQATRVTFMPPRKEETPPVRLPMPALYDSDDEGKMTQC